MASFNTFIRNDGADPIAPALKGPSVAFEVIDDEDDASPPSRLFVFGGVEEESGSVTNNAWFFDLSSGQWTAIIPTDPSAPTPAARQKALVAAVVGSGSSSVFLVTGGRDSTDTTTIKDGVWAYFTDSTRWERVVEPTKVPDEEQYFYGNAYALVPEPSTGNVFIVYKREDSVIKIWPVNPVVNQVFLESTDLINTTSGNAVVSIPEPYIVGAARDKLEAVNAANKDLFGNPVYLYNKSNGVFEFKLQSYAGKVGFVGASSNALSAVYPQGSNIIEPINGFREVTIAVDSDKPDLAAIVDANDLEFILFSYFPPPPVTGKVPLILSTRPNVRLVENASPVTPRLVLYFRDKSKPTASDPSDVYPPTTQTWFLTDFSEALPSNVVPRWERIGATGDQTLSLKAYYPPIVSAGTVGAAATPTGLPRAPGSGGIIEFGGEIPFSSSPTPLYYRTPYLFTVFTNESSVFQWSKVQFEPNSSIDHAAELQTKALAALENEEFAKTTTVEAEVDTKNNTVDLGLSFTSLPPIGPGIIADLTYTITIRIDKVLNIDAYEFDVRLFKPPGNVSAEGEGGDLVIGGVVTNDNPVINDRGSIRYFGNVVELVFTAPSDAVGASYYFRVVATEKGNLANKEAISLRTNGIKLKRRQTEFIAIGIVLAILAILAIAVIGGGVAYYYRRKHHRHSLPKKFDIPFYPPNTLSSR